MAYFNGCNSGFSFVFSLPFSLVYHLRWIFKYEVIEEANSRFTATGLNTGFNPTFGIKTANHGSNKLDGFLTAVGKHSSRRFSKSNVLNAQQEEN